MWKAQSKRVHAEFPAWWRLCISFPKEETSKWEVHNKELKNLLVPWKMRSGGIVWRQTCRRRSCRICAMTLCTANFNGINNRLWTFIFSWKCDLPKRTKFKLIGWKATTTNIGIIWIKHDHGWHSWARWDNHIWAHRRISMQAICWVSMDRVGRAKWFILAFRFVRHTLPIFTSFGCTKTVRPKILLLSLVPFLNVSRKPSVWTHIPVCFALPMLTFLMVIISPLTSTMGRFSFPVRNLTIKKGTTST